MDLRGNNILLQSFADGAKVSLSCNIGYEAAAGKTFITCTAGSWSPVTLICESEYQPFLSVLYSPPPTTLLLFTCEQKKVKIWTVN